MLCARFFAWMCIRARVRVRVCVKDKGNMKLLCLMFRLFRTQNCKVQIFGRDYKQLTHVFVISVFS